MSVVKGLLATTLAFGFISLLGCSDDDPPAPVDTTDPVISNLSHVDLEKVIGSRSITFSADVTDESSLTVTMTHNGISVTVSSSGDTYSANITLADRDNTIVITADDGFQNPVTKTVTIKYPFLAFTNGQAASVVIGQQNFDSIEPQQGTGITNLDTLSNPAGLLIVNDTLYIADTSSQRVVAFNGIPVANDADADFVIGQSSLTGDAGGLTSTSLTKPISLAYDGEQFFILHNNTVDTRVNHWSAFPVGTDAADLVIGQADFGAGSTACENNLMWYATDIFVQGGKLVVADRNHHRVLIWNNIPASSGVAADLVLGQQDFTHCAFNDTNNDGAVDSPTASTLFAPNSVWTDGTRLVVSDEINSRVLIWNSFPTSNFQSADLVLGQAGFTSSDNPSPASATNLRPSDITSNGNQLFIADTASNRIMIWDSWPTNNNQEAARVLGANDFLDDKTNLTNASLFDSGDGLALAVTDGKLLLSEGARNRVLIFEAP